MSRPLDDAEINRRIAADEADYQRWLKLRPLTKEEREAVPRYIGPIKGKRSCPACGGCGEEAPRQ